MYMFLIPVVGRKKLLLNFCIISPDGLRNLLEFRIHINSTPLCHWAEACVIALRYNYVNNCTKGITTIIMMLERRQISGDNDDDAIMAEYFYPGSFPLHSLNSQSQTTLHLILLE